jgi:D-alanyl-D-alanine carboxypeptidase (penicillin-binding protein 5/6)
MKKIIRITSFALALMLLLSTATSIFALEIKEPTLDINAKSAVLMDAKTGTVLYSLNKDIPLPPASVTKVMTLLLAFEAIEKGNLNYTDELTVSEHASSMGGSQVFLEPGEVMCVEELLKCVIVASANDAALTLAEHIAGSEEAFVAEMNKRANELNMKNTRFENVTGLDDDTNNHVTSAYDIALMSKELIKHNRVSEYATIWMDTIRNGEFGLTNTNRLVRFYKGITGLKTGSTSKAGFCISATAKRDGLELIAVIMGAESSEIRNNCAAKLLDYGFANYSMFYNKSGSYNEIPILCVEKDYFNAYYEEFFLLGLKKNKELTSKILINENISAPIKKDDIIGKIEYFLDGEKVGESNVLSAECVNKISYLGYLIKIFKKFLLIN